MRRRTWHDGASVACVVCCACTSAVAPPTPNPVAPIRAQPSAQVSAAAPARAANTLPAPDASQFLAGLSLELSATLAPGTAELMAPGYQGSNLGELTARQLLLQRSPDGRILVRLAWPNYIGSALPVQVRETHCSFVADCEEPAVRRVEGALRKAHPSPTAGDVLDFVARFIEHKHMSRGFDIASVVALKREGDCTEHAVLTAALLRVSGFPSHIVTGVVVVRVQGRLLAFGHAWAEYHDGASWRLADATNVTQPPQPMAYIPLRVMENESASYGRDQFSGFDTLVITAVAVPESLSLAAPARAPR